MKDPDLILVLVPLNLSFTAILVYKILRSYKAQLLPKKLITEANILARVCVTMLHEALFVMLRVYTWYTLYSSTRNAYVRLSLIEKASIWISVAYCQWRRSASLRVTQLKYIDSADNIICVIDYATFPSHIERVWFELSERDLNWMRDVSAAFSVFW